MKATRDTAESNNIHQITRPSHRTQTKNDNSPYTTAKEAHPREPASAWEVFPTFCQRSSVPPHGGYGAPLRAQNQMWPEATGLCAPSLPPSVPPSVTPCVSLCTSPSGTGPGSLQGAAAGVTAKKSGSQHPFRRKGARYPALPCLVMSSMKFTPPSSETSQLAQPIIAEFTPPSSKYRPVFPNYCTWWFWRSI